MLTWILLFWNLFIFCNFSLKSAMLLSFFKEIRVPFGVLKNKQSWEGEREREQAAGTGSRQAGWPTAWWEGASDQWVTQRGRPLPESSRDSPFPLTPPRSPQRLWSPVEWTWPGPAMASLLKVDQEVKLKVDSFREWITSEAEDLVANFFPKKLLGLDSFLKEPILNIHDLTQIHSDMNLPVPDPILLTNSHDGLDGPTYKKRRLDECEEAFQGTKVFVMPNGMLKSNQQLVDIIEKVKPEIWLLIEKCNTVKMWVQLLIPRIEDGNNFGVSIQEEIVAELRTVESEAASCLDQISRYYITRAKLVSKIAKYPHVEDCHHTVTEINEKEYISLQLITSELRNQYVTLHDMILKNIEKIKRPRSSNAETLSWGRGQGQGTLWVWLKTGIGLFVTWLSWWGNWLEIVITPLSVFS